MIIRRPVDEDKLKLKTLFQCVIKDTYEKEGLSHMTDEINDEVHQKMVYLEQDLESDGEIQHFLIAESEEQIIGCAAYGPSSHLIYDHIAELKDVLELGSVFVHPNYQNQRIGKQLVTAVLNDLSKVADQFCLDSGYTIAKKIWTKRFGKPQLILKDYWGEGFDHYIWHISIKVRDIESLTSSDFFGS